MLLSYPAGVAQLRWYQVAQFGCTVMLANAGRLQLCYWWECTVFKVGAKDIEYSHSSKVLFIIKPSHVKQWQQWQLEATY